MPQHPTPAALARKHEEAATHHYRRVVGLKDTARWLRGEDGGLIKGTPGRMIGGTIDRDGTCRVHGACALGYAGMKLHSTRTIMDGDLDVIEDLACENDSCRHLLHAAMTMFDAGDPETAARLMLQAADLLEGIAAAHRAMHLQYANTHDEGGYFPRQDRTLDGDLVSALAPDLVPA